MILLDLFLGFLQVGCFAFGGAYGAIPLIRDVVIAHGWLTGAQIADMIAVSESTPGPIMVNLATYVGSDQAGFAGAAAATLGVILPSFVIILLVMGLFGAVLKHPYVQAALRGMKPCIIGIILATGVMMLLQGCMHEGALDPRAALIAVLLGIANFAGKRLRKKPVSPIALIVFSAVLGAVLYAF